MEEDLVVTVLKRMLVVGQFVVLDAVQVVALAAAEVGLDHRTAGSGDRHQDLCCHQCQHQERTRE